MRQPGARKAVAPFEVTLSDADPVTDDTEYPGVGALVYTDVSGIIHVQCSAIEFDSTRILTAAHCFSATECFTGIATAYAQNSYRFVLGHSAVFPVSATPVVSWTIEDDFTPSTCAADLAIATLVSSAPHATGLLSPANIGPVAVGAEIVKVGYGWFSAHDDRSGELRPAGERGRARMVVNAPQDPERSPYYQYGPARNRDSQICTGDSGGPAFREVGDHRMLVGITSNGDVSGHCRTQPMDTALWSYRDWIVAHDR